MARKGLFQGIGECKSFACKMLYTTICLNPRDCRKSSLAALLKLYPCGVERGAFIGVHLRCVGLSYFVIICKDRFNTK